MAGHTNVARPRLEAPVNLPDQLLPAAIFIAALVSALVGGIFFAFSNFVMRALARLPPAQGMAAMQSINVTVLNPLFLSLFVGNTALCLLLALYALVFPAQPGCGWLLAGAALYVLGNFVVTMACNVPRNQALARLDAASPGAEAPWRDYVREWTRWNHARAVTAIGAAALLTMALVTWSQP